MKRREIIKMGSAFFGGAVLSSLIGCRNIKKNNLDDKGIDKDVKIEDNILSIVPKQTAPYEFSSPMPFDKTLIDDLYNMNKRLKRGKIKILYSSIPAPLGGYIHPYFESHTRGVNEKITSLDDYLDFIKYASKKGFKCLYALNSTKTITDYDRKEIGLIIYELFQKLKTAGIKDVKISNPLLLAYFQNKMPDINLHLSTSMEYHSVQHYQYTLKQYPNIKSINIATDENHNFNFLHHLKQLFPNIKLELMVNETACVKFCIARFYHPAGSDRTGFDCRKYTRENPHTHIARNNLIYPWDTEYYSALGINNFKFTCLERHNIDSLSYLKDWINCLENGIDGYYANDISKIQDELFRMAPIRFNDDMKLAELIKYLPDTKYFIKNGSKCAVNCGTTCKYCYNIAEELKKISFYTS